MGCFFASECFGHDKDLVMRAEQKGKHSSEFASNAQKNDREVVMDAVELYGFSIEVF